MTQLKDYLHLYLGCEVQWKFDLKSKFWFIGIDGDKVSLRTKSGASIFPVELKDITLILRPLSEMTEEETKEHDQIEMVKAETPTGRIVHDANAVKWLLSKHFDLFNLIEKGLAIDATTINNQNPAK
jgi:hypothetical protein